MAASAGRSSGSRMAKPLAGHVTVAPPSHCAGGTSMALAVVAYGERTRPGSEGSTTAGNVGNFSGIAMARPVSGHAHTRDGRQSSADTDSV